MALCEGQLESSLTLKEEESESAELSSPDKKPVVGNNGTGIPMFSSGLAVDYRSPRSHFLPPEIEYSRRALISSHASTGSSTSIDTLDSSLSGGAPAKRKRGRPRVDKTSSEYLARVAARKEARESAAAAMNSSSELVEKRKRGRPRIDKTTPEYLARKRAKELEAIEKKAQRHKRRTTGDSAASSSAGEGARAKRKYTRRAPAGGAPGADQPKKRGRKKKMTLGADGHPVAVAADKPRGKRGRRRKSEAAAAASAAAAGAGAAGGAAAAHGAGRPRPRFDSERALIINSEPITVDSDDEPNLGSPGAGSDSLSLDENLRALRHLHEKYANLGRDDDYSAHLLAARFRQRAAERSNRTVEAEVSAEPAARVRRDVAPGAVAGAVAASGATTGAGGSLLEPHIEKLEDSSDSDSSSSGSGSSSSGSSTSGSSSSSDSSSEESGGEEAADGARGRENGRPDVERSGSASPIVKAASPWRVAETAGSDSESERRRAEEAEPSASISESDNESVDKSFQCPECRKWFSTNVTLKIHKRKHARRGSGSNSRWRRRTAGMYECDCCPETFSCRENLVTHRAEAHRGAMTIRCDVCRRCFEDEHELAAHDRTHTADERASRCGECGSQFQRWEQLRRHRACVHPPPAPARHPHACHQCGKAFGHAHSLTRHLANHSKAVYRCVVCKASFGHADELAEHLNSHLANYKRLKN